MKPWAVQLRSLLIYLSINLNIASKYPSMTNKKLWYKTKKMGINYVFNTRLINSGKKQSSRFLVPKWKAMITDHAPLHSTKSILPLEDRGMTYLSRHLTTLWAGCTKWSRFGTKNIKAVSFRAKCGTGTYRITSSTTSMKTPVKKDQWHQVSKSRKVLLH